MCVCVNAERGQPALSGPENQIDLNFMRIRAGGGGGRDPDWVTPAAFIRTAPHTHQRTRRCALNKEEKDEKNAKRIRKVNRSGSLPPPLPSLPCSGRVGVRGKNEKKIRRKLKKIRESKLFGCRLKT